MEIQISIIDSYDDDRFSKKVLHQHEAFIVNKSMVYEVEIQDFIKKSLKNFVSSQIT